MHVGEDKRSLQNGLDGNFGIYRSRMYIRYLYVHKLYPNKCRAESESQSQDGFD